MEQAWNRVYEICRNQAAGDGRRLTNIVLAAAIAQRLGLVPQCEALQTSLEAATCEVIRQLGSSISTDDLPWPSLEAAMDFVELYSLDPRSLDGWVEAFQSADKNRKSLGAYATPSAFADPLAREGIGPAADRLPRIVDPAAGAGNLLTAAYRWLVAQGHDELAAAYSLYGVELDPAARELCVLLLWLGAAKARPDLARIARNVTVDNALTRDWWSAPVFDVLLMNPPWESLRHDAGGELNVERDATLERLEHPRPGSPDLPALYTAHGRGDRNLFKAFVELAPHLVVPGGRIGALIPAAFGSDLGMAQLRTRYLEQLSVERWTCFENRRKHFAIDSRYKFGLLFATRSDGGSPHIEVRHFALDPEEIHAPHVQLRREEIDVIGGADRMLPELVSDQERAVLLKMLRGGSGLFAGGGLGTVHYRREADLTLGRARGQFWHAMDAGRTPQTELSAGAGEIVPLLEGRMVGQYDCFQKSWVEGVARTAKWEANGDRPLSECRSQFVAPRQPERPGRVALCDVTSATNTRTVLATLVPRGWLCGNTAPVLQFETDELAEAGLAVLNSMVFDWQARRLVGGLHLNKFYLARLTWPHLPPTAVERLAELGRRIAGSRPRGGLSYRPASANCLSPEDIERCFALVEYEVASAFGLGLEELEVIFSNSRSDRRGFWRYFGSDPCSIRVAEMTLAAVRRGDPPPWVKLAA